MEASPADLHSIPPADVPHPADRKDSARRWFDAGEDQSHPALRCHVGLTADGRGREVEGVGPVMERRITVRVRRILYAFGWLVALALAVGAGWKV